MMFMMMLIHHHARARVRDARTKSWLPGSKLFWRAGIFGKRFLGSLSVAFRPRLGLPMVRLSLVTGQRGIGACRGVVPTPKKIPPAHSHYTGGILESNLDIVNVLSKLSRSWGSKALLGQDALIVFDLAGLP